MRKDWGRTVNFLREFNANAIVNPGGPALPFALDFAPVGTLQDFTFEVGTDVAYVQARATIGENTLAISLVDPDGVRYGSAIALPVLGDTVTTGAPGKPGTWRVQVRGIGSVSGNDLDPLNVTNGYGLPGTVEGEVSFLKSGGYAGMDDVRNHAARTAIEYAVSARLVDGYSDRKFRPDAVLKRSELAQYLVMGGSVRQQLPLSGVASFADLAAGTAAYAYAESAVSRGAPLRDLEQDDAGVMGLLAGQFRPNDSVTRVSLAYSLVQALGQQGEATSFNGPLTVFFDGKRIPIEDAGSIAAPLRGYVQSALDRGVINARFAVTQGPFDLQPTLRAYFDPASPVTRAAYAVAAGRFDTAYRSAED